MNVADIVTQYLSTWLALSNLSWCSWILLLWSTCSLRRMVRCILLSGLPGWEYALTMIQWGVCLWCCLLRWLLVSVSIQHLSTSFICVLKCIVIHLCIKGHEYCIYWNLHMPKSKDVDDCGCLPLWATVRIWSCQRGKTLDVTNWIRTLLRQLSLQSDLVRNSAFIPIMFIDECFALDRMLDGLWNNMQGHSIIEHTPEVESHGLPGRSDLCLRHSWSVQVCRCWTNICKVMQKKIWTGEE